LKKVNFDLTNKNQNYLQLISYPYGSELTVSKDEKEFLKKIDKGNVNSMFNYGINLAEGLYGEDKKILSEK
jgi:hypothetical protein